jgi:hypothetical protein
MLLIAEEFTKALKCNDEILEKGNLTNKDDTK